MLPMTVSRSIWNPTMTTPVGFKVNQIPRPKLRHLMKNHTIDEFIDMKSRYRKIKAIIDFPKRKWVISYLITVITWTIPDRMIFIHVWANLFLVKILLRCARVNQMTNSRFGKRTRRIMTFPQFLSPFSRCSCPTITSPE